MAQNAPPPTHPNAEKKLLFTVVVYLSGIALVEILTFYINVMAGTLASALIVFLAVNHTARTPQTELKYILPAIALLPLMRLWSVVLPVAGWPAQVWYVLVSTPTLISAAMIAYTHRIQLSSLGLQRSPWQMQLPIALSGIPLGFIGFLILRPEPLFETSGPLLAAINGLVVLVFIAFAEEIVFRGLLLHALTKISDPFGLLASALTYGVLHIGSNSLMYAIFMGLVGWLFARFVLQTHSIWGVVGAHFFLTVGMGLLWPHLLA